MREVSLLYVKNFLQSSKCEFDLDLCPPLVIINSCVKYHFCMSKGNGVIVWKQYRLVTLDKSSELIGQGQNHRSLTAHSQPVSDTPRSKW